MAVYLLGFSAIGSSGDKKRKAIIKAILKEDPKAVGPEELDGMCLVTSRKKAANLVRSLRDSVGANNLGSLLVLPITEGSAGYGFSKTGIRMIGNKVPGKFEAISNQG